jgi:putative flippase GtrA
MIFSLNMRDLISKLLHYALTGGIAAIVDAGGFALLIKAQCPTLPSGVTSFSIAALVNYCLTARFVFNQQISIRGFAAFMLAALAGLTVNVGTTIAGISFFDLAPIIAKIVGIGTAFLVNFGLNAGIVFHTKERMANYTDRN